MKFLALFFLVGFAAASFHDALDDASEEFYQNFLLGMEDAPSLFEALGLPNHPDLQQAEDDVKNELGERLRKTLDEILEKMRDSIDKGKLFKDDLKNKMDDILKRMKDLKIDIGERAKELREKVREKIKNFFRDIMDKVKDKETRSVEQHFEFNLREMFRNLKKSLLEKIDKESLKTRIEEIFGKGSEIADSLLEVVNKKGEKYKQKLLDFIDRFLGKDNSSAEKRSISEMWEKVKDYFKNLNIDLKEKYMKFGEWVKEVVNKGLEKTKSKKDTIIKIAQEFRDHAKNVSKEVAQEALEFLRPYKEDLGTLWDQVKETVKDIVKKQE